MAIQRKINADLLYPELVFTTSRSSGPGGQNVNKVNSKVTLKWDVIGSTLINPDEKEIILKKLASRLTKDGVLILNAEDQRSQLQNREGVLIKFDRVLAKAFEKKKVRKATKPSKGSIQNRISNKKQKSEKKKWRQKPI
jgi:ribosome-associated protein